MSDRICFQFGAVEYRNEAKIEEVRRITHDRLIEGLGDRRRSGVRWWEAEGERAIEVVRKVDEMGNHEYPLGGSGGYDGLIRFLEENPRAVLVIAEADSI